MYVQSTLQSSGVSLKFKPRMSNIYLHGKQKIVMGGVKHEMVNWHDLVTMVTSLLFVNHYNHYINHYIILQLFLIMSIFSCHHRYKNVSIRHSPSHVSHHPSLCFACRADIYLIFLVWILVTLLMIVACSAHTWNDSLSRSLFYCL